MSHEKLIRCFCQLLARDALLLESDVRREVSCFPLVRIEIMPKRQISALPFPIASVLYVLSVAREVCYE